ncbi:uncharacterized protein DS421_16g550030 [Arachis hypogaea]|nr:uncharacterized protein DS421_16g550030 [Arachis hypogaea]
MPLCLQSPGDTFSGMWHVRSLACCTPIFLTPLGENFLACGMPRPWRVARQLLALIESSKACQSDTLLKLGVLHAMNYEIMEAHFWACDRLLTWCVVRQLESSNLSFLS